MHFQSIPLWYWYPWNFQLNHPKNGAHLSNDLKTLKIRGTKRNKGKMMFAPLKKGD